jgi:hypothetical protein
MTSFCRKSRYDRLLRKQAELDNSRKRMQREKEDFLQHATTDLEWRCCRRWMVSSGTEAAGSAVPEQFYKGWN